MFSSKLSSAKDFRRWITTEILPAIRKHGVYITEEMLDRLQEDSSLKDELLQMLIDEKTQRDKLKNKIQEIAPKARYHDIVLQCENAVQTSIIAKDYAMSCTSFNSLLNGLRIQYKAGPAWVLYQAYAGNGYTVTKTYRVSDKVAKIHTYWTQLGRRFLYDTLKQYGILPEAERLDGAFAGGDDNLR